MLPDDAVVPLACGRIPGAFLAPPTFEPRLGHLADRPARPLDALAPVQAGERLGALGLGVGLAFSKPASGAGGGALVGRCQR